MLYFQLGFHLLGKDCGLLLLIGELQGKQRVGCLLGTGLDAASGHNYSFKAKVVILL